MIADIVVDLIVGITAISLGGLWFTDRLLKRERRVEVGVGAQLDELRKSRAEWLGVLKNSVYSSDREQAAAQVRKLDDQIYKLMKDAA